MGERAEENKRKVIEALKNRTYADLSEETAKEIAKETGVWYILVEYIMRDLHRDGWVFRSMEDDSLARLQRRKKDLVKEIKEMEALKLTNGWKPHCFHEFHKGQGCPGNAAHYDVPVLHERCGGCPFGISEVRKANGGTQA